MSTAEPTEGKSQELVELLTDPWNHEDILRNFCREIGRTPGKEEIKHEADVWTQEYSERIETIPELYAEAYLKKNDEYDISRDEFYSIIDGMVAEDQK